MLVDERLRLAVGNSMLPFLKPADLIILSHFKIEFLKNGDLIVFKQNECPYKEILHRVVFKARDNSFVLAKGDNGAYIQRVFSKDLVGKVEVVKRNGKNYNLNSSVWEITSRILAAISLITFPISAVYKKIIEPLVLSLANKRSHYCAFVFSGRKLECYVFKLYCEPPQQEALRIKGYFGQTRCGSFDLFLMKHDNKASIFICNFYIRFLHRNAYVVREFIQEMKRACVSYNCSEVFLVLDDYILRYANIFLQLGYRKADVLLPLSECIFVNPDSIILEKNND
jgi:signal peptidase I